jgi:hypothetical protein
MRIIAAPHQFGKNQRFRNRELVALAGLNDDFTPVALADGARNRASEVTVTEPVEDHLQEPVKCLAELRPAGLRDVIVCRFVTHCAAAPSCPLWSKKMRGAERRLRRHKSHHVFAPGWAIAEHKDLAPPFGAQVDQIVARATQVAGEIEIARLERDFARGGLDANRQGPLTRDLTTKQAQSLEPDAHGDHRDQILFGERTRELVHRFIIALLVKRA